MAPPGGAAARAPALNRDPPPPLPPPRGRASPCAPSASSPPCVAARGGRPDALWPSAAVAAADLVTDASPSPPPAPPSPPLGADRAAAADEQPAPSLPLLASVPGRLLLLGFGSVGAAVLPLLLGRLGVAPGALTILTAPDRAPEAKAAAARHRLPPVVVATLTETNYEAVLCPLLSEGDVCVNLTVDVCSLALIALCARLGVLYTDTVVEPWAGAYSDPARSPAERSNYALRERLLALRRALAAAAARGGGEGGVGPSKGPTALVTHGANPGLVTHLAKRALLDIRAAARRSRSAAASGDAVDAVDIDAFDGGDGDEDPAEGWAALARALGVRVVHVSERDTQRAPASAPASAPRRPGEFVNTWSVDGFVAEALHQPAELGWGTHEGGGLPPGGCAHASGCGAAVHLSAPGACVRVRSWAPAAGPFHGFLVSHHESIAIADWLTVHAAPQPAPPAPPRPPLYRPTVHYAYLPCDAAVASLHDLVGSGEPAPRSKRLLQAADLAGCGGGGDGDGAAFDAGGDELGVLMGGWAAAGGGGGGGSGAAGRLPGACYWLGSNLSARDAAARAPDNTATSLQVAATVLGGVAWMLLNPREGVVEPEEVPGWRYILSVAAPYVAPLAGEWGDWTPGAAAARAAAGGLFPPRAPADGGGGGACGGDDPWRFAHVLV